MPRPGAAVSTFLCPHQPASCLSATVASHDGALAAVVVRDGPGAGGQAGRGHAAGGAAVDGVGVGGIGDVAVLVGVGRVEVVANLMGLRGVEQQVMGRGAAMWRSGPGHARAAGMLACCRLGPVALARACSPPRLRPRPGSVECQTAGVKVAGRLKRRATCCRPVSESSLCAGPMWTSAPLLGNSAQPCRPPEGRPIQSWLQGRQSSLQFTSRGQQLRSHAHSTCEHGQTSATNRQQRDGRAACLAPQQFPSTAQRTMPTSGPASPYA